MRSKLLITSIFAAATLFTVAGCSSNQAVKTTDGQTVVSYKNAQTGQTEQINRDQVKSMSELDN